MPAFSYEVLDAQGQTRKGMIEADSAKAARNQLRAQAMVPLAVEPVADGLDALERARQFVPNLVIMDIQLPIVSGLDLIEQAKADSTLRAIPVLAVTAYAGKGDEERIRQAGAEGYLAKPVSIGPFMAAVKGLVERGA